LPLLLRSRSNVGKRRGIATAGKGEAIPPPVGKIIKSCLLQKTVKHLPELIHLVQDRLERLEQLRIRDESLGKLADLLLQFGFSP
jgi:hypothetical protein